MDGHIFKYFTYNLTNVNAIKHLWKNDAEMIYSQLISANWISGDNYNTENNTEIIISPQPFTNRLGKRWKIIPQVQDGGPSVQLPGHFHHHHHPDHPADGRGGAAYHSPVSTQ